MLAERYETVLLDLDGVVLLGETAIPGAVASIRELRDRGKRVRFVTNNSRSTPEAIARTLRDCGIDATPEEIVSSGWATAEYVARQGTGSAAVIGTPGVAEMVRERGVAVPTERDAPVASADGDADSGVDSVVVGHDDGVTYADIERAARLIYHGGADFVAANTDGRFPTADGIAPGTGAITAAIEAATGVAPTVVGKPEPHLFEAALDGADPDGAVMVGDNPTADVAGAANAGVDAVLVTGAPDGTATPAESPTERRDPTTPAITDDGGGDGDAGGPRPVATITDLTDLFDGTVGQRP